jgi:hypothetical protein
MPREIKKPPIPPNTCPHIDRVIELIDEIEENIGDKELVERSFEIMKAELEYIRRANELLRESSYHWYKKRT